MLINVEHRSEEQLKPLYFVDWGQTDKKQIFQKEEEWNRVFPLEKKILHERGCLVNQLHLLQTVRLLGGNIHKTRTLTHTSVNVFIYINTVRICPYDWPGSLEVETRPMQCCNHCLRLTKN